MRQSEAGSLLSVELAEGWGGQGEGVQSYQSEIVTWAKTKGQSLNPLCHPGTSKTLRFLRVTTTVPFLAQIRF